MFDLEIKSILKKIFYIYFHKIESVEFIYDSHRQTISLRFVRKVLLNY